MTALKYSYPEKYFYFFQKQSHFLKIYSICGYIAQIYLPILFSYQLLKDGSYMVATSFPG